MPFANKFCAMMHVPFAGDRVGDLVVESVDARDVPGGPGQHAYSVRMVVQGPGGREAVRRILQDRLSPQPLAFSAYGHPYQLYCGKPEVLSLGEGRYEVTVAGAGMRVYLEEQLVRFAGYLAVAGAATERDPATVVREYLAGYAADLQREANRYRSRLRRRERAGGPMAG